MVLDWKQLTDIGEEENLMEQKLDNRHKMPLLANVFHSKESAKSTVVKAKE
jgi:hypothetical protein